MTKKSAGDSYCALYGHEYGIGIRADELAGVKANLARCFEHLSERTELLDVIRSGYGHAIELPLTFRLADTTITATPDLVFRTATGQLMIIDWKVAQSETSDYSRQLGVYAVAAVRCGRWIGVSPDTIALLEVNLLKNVVRQHAVNSEQFEDTEDFIYRSNVEQKALLGSGKFVDLKP